ncbi:MAG: hypothetical protein AB7F78_25740, partial [Hyphomicrobiaceae bacterium]
MSRLTAPADAVAPEQGASGRGFSLRALVSETAAGLVVFFVQLIQAIGFVALVFQGELRGSLGLGLWSL